MPSTEADALARVLERGRHLRRRHRLAVRASGAFAVVTCMLGVVAAVSTAGPGPSRVVRAAGAPTTSTATRETTREALTTSEVPLTTAPPRTRAHETHPTTTSTAPAGAIFGFVHFDGRPVEGEDMQLQDDTGRQWRTTTRPDGGYRFDGLAAGHYGLVRHHVIPPSCAPSGSPCIAGQNMERRDVLLTAGEQHEEGFANSSYPTTTSSTTATTTPA